MNFVRIWCIANPTLARRVTPPWNVYMGKFDPGWEGYPVWQTGLLALSGHPTYHVNAIKLKWEVIWTGGLPKLSGLPHLPGVPHLHVNRPLVIFCHGVNTIKLSKVKISTCQVIILSSENNSDTCVFFFTLFNEFITGCIPQVTGTQQVWDVTYCNQPITTFRIKGRRGSEK